MVHRKEKYLLQQVIICTFIFEIFLWNEEYYNEVSDEKFA